MSKETQVIFSIPGSNQKKIAILNKGSADMADGMILSHGAGGNSKSGNLPQIAKSFSDAGFWCLRFDYAPPNLKGRVQCCEVSGSRDCMSICATVSMQQRETFFWAFSQALLKHAHVLSQQGKMPVRKWILAGHSMVRSLYMSSCIQEAIGHLRS